MSSLPYRRQSSRQASRQASTDDREAVQAQMDYYIGIDVGTGSARACIINDKGDIVGLASENIGLWQPQQSYYVCDCSRRVRCGRSLLTSGCIGTIYLRYLALYLHFCPACHQSAQHQP